jgi:hypothetical protein
MFAGRLLHENTQEEPLGENPKFKIIIQEGIVCYKKAIRGSFSTSVLPIEHLTLVR